MKGADTEFMERRSIIENSFRGLQQNIIAALEQEDGKGRFSTENWERTEGGGGITRLLSKGKIIEKGGVNFSAVYGKTPDAIKKGFSIDAEEFFASGVSVVLHPENPFVPIIHMNVRYFELSSGEAWFGGGIDLTPAYVFHEDGLAFHQALKTVCDRFDPQWYHQFKAKADRYFYLPHRQECRGIGGIFYDRIKPQNEKDFEKLLAFSLNLGNTFAPVYTTLMRKHSGKEFTEENKNWQLHRRARYVEFNLVHDAGTRFGLETNGRTESILMSLPPMARWESNFIPEAGSAEEKSQQYFSLPIDWIG
jgi:coproporphyrinogen III oxidase